jgi:molecular chaperone GrpE
MEENEEEIVLEEEGEALTNTLKKLRERLKVATKEKQEYLEGWQRARADYTNEKRDAEAKKAELVSDVKARTAEKLIPLVDSFELALSQESFKTLDAAWKTGITSLRDEAARVLKELGVETFNPVGETFDPNTMNAVRELPGEDHSVIAVDRQGFKMGERVIRPAYVAVGKAK